MDGILDQTSNQPPQYISRSLPMLDATAALFLFVGRIFLGFLRCNFDSKQELD